VENVEYFKYLGSLETNYARCTSEIKSRIANGKSDMQQNHFVSFFHQKTFVAKNSEMLHLGHGSV
jgi:hypothetical protein